MRLTRWTLVLVLIGLLVAVGVDVDHLLISVDGGLSISNLECILQGFRSLVSEGAKACMLNQQYGVAYLHSMYVGLFLLAFVISYYVVMKNE